MNFRCWPPRWNPSAKPRCWRGGARRQRATAGRSDRRPAFSSGPENAQGYGALIAERRYEPAGFKAALALKDVRLALAAAETASVSLPLGELVRDSLLDVVDHQEGEMDLAVLGRAAARRSR